MYVCVCTLAIYLFKYVSLKNTDIFCTLSLYIFLPKLRIILHKNGSCSCTTSQKPLELLLPIFQLSCVIFRERESNQYSILQIQPSNYSLQPRILHCILKNCNHTRSPTIQNNIALNSLLISITVFHISAVIT